VLDAYQTPLTDKYILLIKNNQR